jgi:hypothetical protein
MKKYTRSVKIILFITIVIVGFFYLNCKFDPGGVAGPLDSRFAGCWENEIPDEVWGKVVLDLKPHDQNLLTGSLFILAESLATIIPYSLEGEVEAKGVAVLQATLHADPTLPVVLVATLDNAANPTMTLQMIGKPQTVLNECQ